MTLIHDKPENEYHADQDSLSASGAKILLGKRPPAQDTDALLFGRLVHTVILEPHKLDQYAVMNADVIGVKKDGSPASNPRNTDAWRDAVFAAKRDGLTVIDGGTLVRAQAVAAAVQDHPEAARLLAQATDHEVSAYAQHPSGAQVRARIDAVLPDALVDIKTCRDANPDDFGKVMNMLMYHVSAANYIDIARANGLTADRFDLICVETEPTPTGKYRVSVNEIHEDAIDKGRELMAEACDRWLALGKRIDLPDYGAGRHTVDLPGWAYDNDFEDIQIGGAA